MSNPKTTRPKHVRDNRSNQLDPQHPEYYRSRGIDPLQAQCFAVRRQRFNELVVKKTSQSPKPNKTK